MQSPCPQYGGRMREVMSIDRPGWWRVMSSRNRPTWYARPGEVQKS
jgi:predicted NUDIX family NTP pyrophosphohydrolase